jgi:hypothetical protein
MTTKFLEPDHPFFSPERRLLRAHTHISELDREIRRFFDSRPHSVFVERDLDGLNESHKIKLTKPIPLDWGDIAFDALVNLRSVLDQIGYAAAVASGKNEPKKTSFPIGDDAVQLDNAITGYKVCRDVPTEIVTIFRGFKPYKTGNNAIWALNRLRNSAHTRLIAVGASMSHVIVKHYPPQTPLGVKAKWDSSKNEIVFARGPLGHKWNYNVQPSFVVGFDEISVTGRTQAVSQLRGMADQVTRVFRVTYDECTKLGLI